ARATARGRRTRNRRVLAGLPRLGTGGRATGGPGALPHPRRGRERVVPRARATRAGLRNGRTWNGAGGTGRGRRHRRTRNGPRPRTRLRNRRGGRPRTGRRGLGTWSLGNRPARPCRRLSRGRRGRGNRTRARWRRRLRGRLRRRACGARRLGLGLGLRLGGRAPGRLLRGLGLRLLGLFLRAALGGGFVLESLSQLTDDRRLDRRGRRPDELAHLVELGHDDLALDTEFLGELVYPDLRHCTP